jgi:hypothetical protein
LNNPAKSGRFHPRLVYEIFKTLLAQDPAFMFGNAFPAEKSTTVGTASSGFAKFVVVTLLISYLFQTLVLISILVCMLCFIKVLFVVSSS